MIGSWLGRWLGSWFGSEEIVPADFAHAPAKRTFLPRAESRRVDQLRFARTLTPQITARTIAHPPNRRTVAQSVATRTDYGHRTDEVIQ